MTSVFLPLQSNSGSGLAIAKSHVAKLAAENRRKAKQRLALDCLNGAPLPTNSLLVVKLLCRQGPNSDPNSSNKRQHLWKQQKRYDRGPPSSLAHDGFPQPMTILKQGNLDPFDTAVLVIDSTANEILAFNRDCVAPWINSMANGRNLKFVKDSFAALHDKATAHASLASLAIVMSNATGNEKIRSYALRLVGHAYAGLQERLSVSADDFSIPTRVFTLFVFEYMSHSPVAAAIHVQGLQNLLLERKERGQVLDHLLISAAEWNDNVRSLRFLMPPILNAEVLLAPELLEDAEGVARLLEEHGLLESEPADLFAETGIPPRVEYLYKRFMYLLRIGRSLVMPDAQPFLTHRTTNSWAYATAILASKLNGIFHDARNNLANGQGDSQLLHREMATALSGVYWAFAVSNFEFLDPSTTEYWRYGYPTLSVSMTVLTALSGEINSIDWRSSTENPASLKLWLLYIATLPEQALANHSGNSTTVGHRSKHNLEFVAQARNMGIWEWKAVQEEVGRYLYFADIGPASRPWFDKAMEEY